jgi:hypothetical protein
MSDMEQFNELEDQIREIMRGTGANPEFVHNLRSKLTRMSLPQKQSRFTFRLAWALGILLVVLVIVANLPVVAGAVRQLFGFVPSIGLVEQNSPLRVSEAPVAVTRQGVTLTLQQVIVYADRVELAYRVEGLSTSGSGSSCSGPDMYPSLRLPDGTQIAAKPVALGGEWTATGYTAGHTFFASIPPDVSSADFILKCMEGTERGAAPEDWVVPFNLTAVPQGQPIGKLLEEGNPPQVVQPSEVETNFSFLGGAAKDNGYHFFFRFSAQNPGPDSLAVRPFSMYLIDSSGARIELINALPWSPFDQVDIWEYRAVKAPAPGPMTIYIDGVQVYYLAQKASFEFSPGKDAQVGQSWDLDEHFQIGGHAISVTSARMVEEENHKGFEFTIQADQQDTQIGAEVMDMTEKDPRFQMWSTIGNPAPAGVVTTGFVYESSVPETLRVTFNTISVLKNGSWKVEWTPSQP